MATRTTTVADLVERNKSTPETVGPVPNFAAIHKAGRAGATKIFIVACFDPRCNPTRFFNLGDYEAIIHRNAGGNVRHALRDILMLDRAFDLDEIAIIHHTDCGTLTSTDEQIRRDIKARVTRENWDEVDAIDFGSMVDVEESVKEDVEWFRANPLVRGELKRGCQGFVLDTPAGKVRRV